MELVDSRSSHIFELSHIAIVVMSGNVLPCFVYFILLDVTRIFGFIIVVFS